MLHMPILLSSMGAAPPVVSRSVAQLSTGLAMEHLRCGPTQEPPATASPFLLVHGTFHGAWCWEQHWMERFAAAGLESHAVSLRGTSGSPCDAKSVKISEHVADLRAFVDEHLNGRPPILVGHSFGGASCLKYLEAGGKASGAAFLCSVPPSGNGPMTFRFIRRSIRKAWLIVRGFAMKTATKDAADARALFFDERTPEAVLESYLPRLAADAQIGLDLAHFNANLPGKAADDNGRASWLEAAPPAVVLGAGRDAVVDREGVEETACFLGVEAEFFDLPHDVMLCEGWEAPADRLVAFAKTL